MTEILTFVVGKAFDHTVNPLMNHIGYVFTYKGNFKKFCTSVDELKDKKKRVENSVASATSNGEEIEQDVQNWLAKATKLIEDGEQLVTTHTDIANIRCLSGLCPDLVARYKISKKAVKESKNITEHEQKGSFEGVSFLLPPQMMSVIPSSKACLAFESRVPRLNEIVEALKQDNVNVIGVWGMGGIGKTTLVNQVVKMVEGTDLFDVLVFATVSRNPDIKHIQGEIADRLGLKLRQESSTGRAAKLFHRLKKENRMLIILDDVWEILDLEEVGIPYSDTHKGCKILVTSRDCDVLSRMNAQVIIKVEQLQPGEAQELFNKIAGASIENHSLQETAVKLVEKCKGLPISITTIAGGLKNKGPSEWNNALVELQRPTSKHSMNDAYGSIEVSYNQLASDELKSLFLLCAYMGGYHIIDLVKYGVGLGLYQNIEKIEEALERVQALVLKLERSSLLQDRPAFDQFSIHDVVRDVAISIVSRDVEIFVMRDRVGPKTFPDANKLKDCTAIAVFDVDITKLPDKLDCHKLQFFHIFNKNPSLEIPATFFKLMPDLKVVDLTQMQIPSLPSSLLQLTALQTLCLDHSMLGNISGIGKLKTLEILSFTWSDIEKLPKEVGKLTRLKLLDLDHCSKLKVIPYGVISRLSLLEELSMKDSFDQWEAEGVHRNGRGNASLAELKHLPHLTALATHIRDAELIPEFLFTEKLVRYQISIGDGWKWSGKDESCRTLKLKHSTNRPLDAGVHLLFKKAEDLYLDELKGEGNVLFRLDRECFQQLKHLHVQDNPEVRYIVSSSYKRPCTGDAFPILESLFIDNLINLKKICHGKLNANCLKKLKTVEVKCCGGLKTVFRLSTARDLKQLWKLSVIDCEGMVQIFAAEDRKENEVLHNVTTEIFQLLELQSLELHNLPELVSFCADGKVPPASQIRRSSPMPFFGEKIELPKLESLQLSSINTAKIWQDTVPELPSSFHKLAKLVLHGCNGLEYLLSFAMAGVLVKLKHLEICNCEMMKQIIISEESKKKKTNDIISFPRLTFLKMKDLSNLTKFYSGCRIHFPTLQVLEIENCPKLTTLINFKLRGRDIAASKKHKMKYEESYSAGYNSLFSGQFLIPSLEELKLSCLSIQKIWPDELLPMDSCTQTLTSLIVEGCDNLRYIFPSYMLINLQQLKALEVRDCNAVETLITSATFAKEGKEIKLVFPKLDSLRLISLSKLSRFCSGDSVEFPFLRKLDLENCTELESFISDLTNAFGTISLEPQEMIPKKELHVDPQPLFNEKVGIPGLESLTIGHMNNLTKIWHNNLCTGSFDSLQCVKVEHCNKLLNIFPHSISGRLEKLNLVQIFHCASLEAVFEHHFKKVDTLELGGLPAFKDRSFYKKFETENSGNVKNKDDRIEVLTDQSSSSVHKVINKFKNSAVKWLGSNQEGSYSVLEI